MVTHNDREIDASELFNFLESIGPYFEERVDFYALGGTALTIMEMKPSTRDIDVNVKNRKQFIYVKKIFSDLGFKQVGDIRWRTDVGLQFDLFHQENILGTQLLDDSLSLASFVRSFDDLTLYVLHPFDIIISKLARGDERDWSDIRSIFEFTSVDLTSLSERYKLTMENSVVANYSQKFLDLIDIKFSEWDFDLNLDLIKEVKRWND